jgi:hypothetical protein
MCSQLHLPLHTPRLLLRDFIPADFQAIHASTRSGGSSGGYTYGEPS